MPPSLVDALAERLLERLPADRAYDWNALKDAPMPPSLAHFLRQLLRRRVEIEQEHLRVPRLPWLDYEHDEVRRAEEALLEAVYRHARIPALAWDEAVYHAAEEVSAYLVRPAATLARFAFGAGAPDRTDDRGQERPAGMVLRRLNYFSAYPYLRQAAGAYVEQKNLEVIARAHFDAFLTHVDKRMTHDYDPDDWLTLLDPLFQLADTAHPDRRGVPVSLLIDFFEQKRARSALQPLRTAHRERDLTTLSRDALRDVLAPAAPASDGGPQMADRRPHSADGEDETEAESSVEEEKEEEAAAVEASEETDGDVESPSDDDAAPAGDASTGDGPVPLWQQFQPDSTDPPSEETPEADRAETDRAETDRAAPENTEAETPPRQAPNADAPNADAPNADAPNADAPRPRWQQFEVIEPERPAPTDETEKASDARSLEAVEHEVLGYAAKSRSMFVRHLFGGSQEAYERVLRRLEAAETWQSATQIIARDIFRARQVNIYSDPARSFTDAVEARYR